MAQQTVRALITRDPPFYLGSISRHGLDDLCAEMDALSVFGIHHCLLYEHFGKHVTHHICNYKNFIADKQPSTQFGNNGPPCAPITQVIDCTVIGAPVGGSWNDKILVQGNRTCSKAGRCGGPNCDPPGQSGRGEIQWGRIP